MSEKFFQRVEELVLGPKKERLARLCPHGMKYLDEPVECRWCQGIEEPSRELTAEERKLAEEKIKEIQSISTMENLKRIVRYEAYYSIEYDDEEGQEDADRQMKILEDSIDYLEKKELADTVELRSRLEKLRYEARSHDDTDTRYEDVINRALELCPFDEIYDDSPEALKKYEEEKGRWKERIEKAKKEGKTFYNV